MYSKQRPFSGILILSILFLAGCKTGEKEQSITGPIELPRVVDGSLAYQTDPFYRTVEDVQLFKNEAPCILITHDGSIGVVGRWRTQTLLIAKAGPGEVSYDAITINGYNGYGYDSGGRYSAEYFWSADVSGDGVLDLLVLAWTWGGPGWFEGDPLTTAPENEPAGLRVIIRKATDRGHPLGFASDRFYQIDKLNGVGVRASHLKVAIDSCKDERWLDRLWYVEKAMQD